MARTFSPLYFTTILPPTYYLLYLVDVEPTANVHEHATHEEQAGARERRLALRLVVLHQRATGNRRDDGVAAVA